MAVIEKVEFKVPPEPDDPYKDVKPALAYSMDKRLVEMGVLDKAILEEEYVVTSVPAAESEVPEE